MKKCITIWILLVTLTSLSWAQTAREIDNPQLQMVGARQAGLGGTNPVLLGEISGVFINPATLNSATGMPVSVTAQRLIGFYDYYMVNASVPFEVQLPFGDKNRPQRFLAGFSWGSNLLTDIPRTTLVGGNVQQTGSFSSGFHVVQAGVGTQFYDVFGFDTVATGISGKVYRQHISNDTRWGTGIDTGMVATYFIDNPYIDRLSVGLSIINLVSTSLVWDDGNGEGILPLQFFAGVGAYMLDDRLAAFVHNSPDGPSVASEYTLQENLFVRASTDFNKFSVGTGLQFPNITGIGNSNYTLRLDYNWSQHPSPINDNSHIFTVSILGETRPPKPEILQPRQDQLTQDRSINLKGVGPKNTAIRLYNNDSLVRTAQTDRFGNWVYRRFPLKEGQNKIYAQAYSIERDLSFESDPILVTLDTLPPQLDIQIVPLAEVLQVTVSPNEELTALEANINGDPLTFYREKPGDPWIATSNVPEGLADNSFIPQKMAVLEIFAKDKAENSTQVAQVPFFVELEFPKDRFVHFKDSIRLIGKSSPLVSALEIDGEPIQIDPNLNFSKSKVLKPGKNLLKLKTYAKGDAVLTYTARVLMLKTFPDLDKNVRGRREVEFLATLGLLKADENRRFGPNIPVDRGYITKLLVDFNKISVKDVEGSLFSDVEADNFYAPYIQVAIENGLMFAFPDGTFRPNQTLRLSEIAFLLSNAGIITEEEISPIDDRVVTRAELARFIAFNPRWELRIERLINWDRGYF